MSNLSYSDYLIIEYWKDLNEDIYLILLLNG